MVNQTTELAQRVVEGVVISILGHQRHIVVIVEICGELPARFSSHKIGTNIHEKPKGMNLHNFYVLFSGILKIRLT